MAGGPQKSQCSPGPWSGESWACWKEKEPVSRGVRVEAAGKEVSSERQGVGVPGLLEKAGSWEARESLRAQLRVGSWGLGSSKGRRSKEKAPVLSIFDTLLKSTSRPWNISGHFKQGTSIDFLTFQYKQVISDGLSIAPVSWNQLLLHVSCFPSDFLPAPRAQVT